MLHIKSIHEFVNEAYLSSSRSPLYHSTHTYNAADILNSNQLNAVETFNMDGTNRANRVSFSRSPSYIYFDLPVTFVLDYDKLAANYKIRPYDWFPNSPKIRKNLEFEYEEVIEKDVKNLDRYLTEIRLNKSIDRKKNSKRNTRQEFRESFEDLIKAILEYKENYPSCKVKVLYKGKEVGEKWLLSQLEESFDSIHEDHAQLTIPFREKKYKGKSVHEDLMDALIDLRTSENPDKYHSVGDPDDEISAAEDKAFERILDSNDNYLLSSYIWDFAQEYDPNDNDEHGMYVQKVLDEITPGNLYDFSDAAAEYSISDLLTKSGQDEIKNFNSRFQDDIAEMQASVSNSHSKNEGGLIDCWRTVSYTKGDEKSLYHNITKNYGGVGVYWAWDKDKAEPHWGTSGGHQITLHGQVSVENVDWPETVYISAYGLRDEREIRMKTGGSIKIVGFNDDTIRKYIPLEVPLVVKVGKPTR